MSDAELLRLLQGTPGVPLEPPSICGEVVDTPAKARTMLAPGTCSPCVRLRRAALATTLNIRRSILFGDGLFGADGAACFGVGRFRIVLRCGAVFVPDEATPDPLDAAKVTETTPVEQLVALAGRLCALSECPATNSAPCGKTLGKLAGFLERVNDSKRRRGDCGLCQGDATPPQLSCPAGVLEIECRGPDGALLEYEVTATDDCDPSPVVVGYPPSGTLLPPGAERTVECTATDVAGNVSSCSFLAVVVDRSAPAISCPAQPVVVDCIPGPAAGGAVVNFPVPTATDTCDSSVAVVCDPPSGSFFPLGATTVVCTASDEAGNQDACAFEVVVVEETPLQLVCPEDIVAECSGSEGTVVEYPAPMLTATCGAPPTLDCLPPSGSVFPIGTTRVVCTARHGSKDVGVECSFDITVVDTRPPLISCPGRIEAECWSSGAGTVVEFAPSATDACDLEPAVACDPPSGSYFPLGETTVVCTAVDAAGNSSTCSFVVVVADTTPPVIACPQGPIRVDCNVKGGQPGAIAHFPTPTVTDACDDAPQVVLSHASGDFFPLGRTTVTALAIDGVGNESVCSFDVEVVDEAPPILVCLADMRSESQGPDGAVVDYPLPVVADDCDIAPLLDCQPAPGSLFPPGATLVRAIAIDQSLNSVECSFTITVEDTTPPEIQCPPDRIVECASADGTPVEFVVSAFDVADPAPVVVSFPPSGSLFPTGATVVECTATDASGNSSSCRFIVSVVDTTAPAIACPTDLVVECTGAAGTPVAWSVGAVDACGGAVEVLSDPPSGSSFGLGRTTVACVAADALGNTSRCEFAVTVIDTTAPRIACPAEDITIQCSGANAAPAAYPVPVATDICDEAPTVVCDPPVGTTLPLGRHTVVCTATDAAGNSSGCAFDLVVVDTAAPAIVCGGDIALEATGPDGAVLSYPLPTSSDVCDVAPNLACSPVPGTLFPLGATQVLCSADDASGNMIECAFTVTVVDTTPPSIQCPADISASCEGAEGTVVTFSVTATDACDPAVTVRSEPSSGQRFPIGTTEVTSVATDRAGNSSTCVFHVTVRDDVPPSIVCPEDFETACLDGGTALVVYPAPTVQDGCDPAPLVACDPPSGTRLGRGAHRIVCTAEDAAGNRGVCEFTVTVIDATPPVLVCPANIVLECAGTGGAAVEYATPVANDACDGPRPVECVPASGSIFPSGETEVVCTSSDAAGNEVRCSFLVTVGDATGPEIACPETLVVEQTSPEGSVAEFEVTASDACDSSIEVTVDPPSGSLFAPGSTTVTCVATDDSGNESRCVFTVQVVDRTPPLLACPLPMEFLGTTAGNPPASHEELRWPPQEGPPRYAVTAVATFDLPTASDLAQSQAPQVTASPASGTRLPLGVHSVTVRARDDSGNESTCTFDVSIIHGLRAFIRGDSNLDARFDVADPISVINYLFLGGPPLLCVDAGDSNDDGRLDIADVIYNLNYNFNGGPPPSEPYWPLCGLDPTPDTLDCERYYPCE